MSKDLLPLRQNIRLLGNLLGETIQQLEGVDFFNKVEHVRQLAKKTRLGDRKAHKRLEMILSQLSHDQKYKMAKAYTEFLRLANVAEEVHRIRRRQFFVKSGDSPQRGSPRETLQALKKRGHSRKKIIDELRKIRIDLVLTAHPTEVQLPHAIRRYQKIANLLIALDNERSGTRPYHENLEWVRSQIVSLWLSSVTRESKPSPLDEVRVGLDLVEEILWNALPDFFRALDFACQAELNLPLGVDSTPFRFGSWMGGDRDGNPFVTAETTREVIFESVGRALRLYEDELKQLRHDLDFDTQNSGTLEPVGTELQSHCQDKIEIALDAIEKLRQQISNNISKELVHADRALLLNPLLDIYEELSRKGAQSLANGRVRDLIWRLRTFGLNLLPLDIRQSSDVHESVINEVVKVNNLCANYSTLNENEKVATLIGWIQNPIDIGDTKLFSEHAQEILKTIQLSSHFSDGFFGSYIISMTESVSDVLEVLLLFKWASLKHQLPISPLFETPEALAAAAEIMTSLYKLDVYRETIGSEQEIMLGYSDSAKRSGRIHSAWSIYRLQETLSKIGASFHISTTYFHGRGGTIARGGGPIQSALMGLPRPHKSPHIRVTEQGESITAKFGLFGVAERTLELYLSGFLQARLGQRKTKPAKWIQIVDELAIDSAQIFREQIYERENFIQYFQQVTPISELSLLNIGSRPSRRKQEPKLDSLRAIPWIFAWTQNRALLPAWLGVTESLNKQILKGQLPTLQKMYDSWIFFRSTLDLIEMVLAKADRHVLQYYSDVLVDRSLQGITSDYISQLRAARHLLLKVFRSELLLEKKPVISRSIRIRTPYVDVLNMLQVHLLKEYRENPNSQTQALIRALSLTMSGISAGMRNTG